MKHEWTVSMATQTGTVSVCRKCGLKKHTRRTGFSTTRAEYYMDSEETTTKAGVCKLITDRVTRIGA